MVLPIHHVLRRVDAPLLHPKEVCTIFVMTGIYIHCTIVHHRCRIACTPCLHKGILCRSHHGTSKEKRCYKQFFHHLYTFNGCKDTKFPSIKLFLVLQILSKM